VSILSTGTSSTLNTIQNYSDKQNFMTEFSTDWYDLALMIQQDLVQANASAYIHWELVWGDATDTTGTAVYVNSSGAYTVRAPYYTLKHFAKFIDKGYQRVNIASTNSFAVVSAFKNPSKNEVTIVAVNNATTSTTTSFSLGSSLNISAIQAYQSVYGNYYQTISGLTSTSSVTMPAQSITTIVLDYTAATGATPTVAISAPANNSNLCSGSSVTITALPTISTGSINKVDFYDGTTLLGTATSSPYSYIWTNPSIGSHTIGVIATSAAGVASTKTAETLIVNDLPTVSAGSATAICNGTATVITATGGTSYKWSNGATTAANSVSPTVTTTYSVTGTNASCSTTSSVIVTVNAIPSAPIVTTPVTYTTGATATALTATGTSLKWYTVATGGTPSTSAPIPSTTATGSINYYVSQTTNSCESPRSTIVVTVSQGTITQTISLVQGWNLISFNVSPTDKIIETIFASVLSNVTEVKNADAFWSSVNQSTAFNSLTQISDGGAYLVRMKAAGILTVSGLPTALPFTTTLKSGWNMVGVPAQLATSISTTVGTKPISLVKDFNGYWQSTGTPSITTFDIGKGYFIKATASTTLSW